MSNSADTKKTDICGCCEADLEKTTQQNPPGQSALAYRLGTHSAFLRRMISRLPKWKIADGDNEGQRPLAKLTMRAGNDPSIAMLDAWATIAEVLTFYQERIANEGYLRTATERRSVLQLARAIGYELNPGVAAGTFLVFTVEEAPGAPGIATVPEGTQVQSIPAPGQLPQTFETMEEIETRAEWNKLRPRLTRPQTLAIRTVQGKNKLYLIDTNNFLNKDDDEVDTIGQNDFDQLYMLDNATLADLEDRDEVLAVEVKQIFIPGTINNLKAGELFLVVGKNRDNTIATIILPILRVEVEPDQNRTRVDFAEGAKPPRFKLPKITITASFAVATINFDANQVSRFVLNQPWKQRDFNAFLAMNRWNPKQTQNVVNKITAKPSPKLPPADPGAFAFRERVGFFGHNAPHHKSLPKKENSRGDPYPQDWDKAGGWEIWKDPTKVPESYYEEADVYLERSLPDALENSWVIFERPKGQSQSYQIREVSEASITGFALSGKATGLELADEHGTALEDNSTDKNSLFKVRKTTAHLLSHRLELIPMPIEEDLREGDTELMLDGMVLSLQIGRLLMLSGERPDVAGEVASEVVRLVDVIHSRGYTILRFQEGLKNSYTRRTATLNGNVVRATHGETVANEVLGGGDGSQANQRFRLKKPPLTFVSAATASGAESSLSLRVNGVEWQEVPSLYGLDGNSRSYMVRRDNDGNTTVTFGDGKRGARLPTGQENVVATYRSGIGTSGEVDKNSLTLLKTRPLGIREVTNPLAASGAANPETLKDARVNAPFTVLTLERIVSLQDLEDFARAFAGVGKAQAVALWNGDTQLVHLTVADANGDEVDTRSDLHKNLRDAIDAARDPLQEVQVESFQLLLFNVSAKVLIDPAYKWKEVKGKIEASLLNTFAFAQRSFGQSVTAAEVVEVIHRIEGVMAVDLDELYLVTGSAAPKKTILASVLPAMTARFALSQTEILSVPQTFPLGTFEKKILPAELLLINASGINLTEMKV